MKKKKEQDLLMDHSPSPNLDSEDVPETQASKKRKMTQKKTVVEVKIEDNENGKQKSEGPPPDCWSWRKYGQKPIKGSPYPRGYYRCSTSKGCLAKKQVERCRTDASLIIITYTSSHNHSSPKEPKEEPKTQSSEPTVPKEEDPKEEQEEKDHEPLIDVEGASENNITSSNFHYCHSPFDGSDRHDIIIDIKHGEESPFAETFENVLLDEKEKPLCYPHLMTFSTPKSEENDFYDELGELPTSSSFSSFMRSNFFEDRILVHPS